MAIKTCLAMSKSFNAAVMLEVNIVHELINAMQQHLSAPLH